LRAQKERRKALALLLEVAGGAKAIEDTYRRTYVLTLCADALWETDERSAHSVFSRAWEAAAESDDAELKDEQENGRYGDLPERFTRARELVLTSAARRDTRMAETWLRALTDWLGRHESSARDAPDVVNGGASRDIGPLNEFTRGGQRLALASSLLDEEEFEGAARIAAPALGDGASGALVEFLLSLRTHSPAEADRLYLRLLAATRADASADANDVLLLSSYVFTPRLLAVVGGDGSVQFRALGMAGQESDGTGSSASAGTPVRVAFAETAAEILLRPAQTGVTPGSSSGGATALYFAIGRLLPFIERESPQHAPLLHARRAALAADLEAVRRAALDEQMKARSLTRENPDDPLRTWLDRAERAGDRKLGDMARLSGVKAAASKKLWDRARRLADEVEDEERRRTARSMIAAYQVAALSEAFSDDNDDFEKAVSFVRSAEVSAALRAYGFAQAAELAARRGKSERAAALLGEAFDYASQTEGGTALRDAATMMTATVAARVDSPRAWEALATAVNALNEDEEFTGDIIWFNLETRVKLSPGEPEALNQALQPFTVDEMFDAAARKNFDRALAEARNLKSISARLLAFIAAAEARLDKTPAVGAR
jgi:hypothetical protein